MPHVNESAESKAAPLVSKIYGGLNRWVRGDQAMTPETRTEIAELKAKVAEFERKEVENSTVEPTQIDERFAYGEDDIELSLVHKGYQVGPVSEDGDLLYTWDEIVEVLGPFMIDEAPEPTLRNTLNNHMLLEIQNNTDSSWSEGWPREPAEISDKAWGAIIVQLRALGMITTGTKKRTVADKSVYWKLTRAGDQYMVSLRAIPSAVISVQ